MIAKRKKAKINCEAMAMNEFTRFLLMLNGLVTVLIFIVAYISAAKFIESKKINQQNEGQETQ